MKMNTGDILLVFFKKALLAILAYYIGYLQFSILWIIIAVTLDIVKDVQLKKKLQRKELNRKLVENEEREVMSSLSNLPSWVCFPDMERAEWLNRIIKKLWPNVNNYVHDIIKDIVEARFNKKLAKYKLSGLVFEKLIVGTIPFRITGLIVYEDISRSEIVLDMDISYAGDCHITLKYGKLKGNIKDFELYGRIRVIIKPLIDILPLAGGFQAFFLNPPDIDFDLDGVGGLLELPGFSGLLRKLILDTICSVIVLPNRYPMRFSKKVSKRDIKMPRPEGVLRVHVIQARKLMKRDITFTGNLTSDPYAIISVGDQEHKTPVMEQTTKPKWDYWCEFIVEETNGVYLFISLWDYDSMQEDEPLGRAKVELSKLVMKQNADMWINLSNVKHGEVHIRTSWLSLSIKPHHLQEIKNEIKLLKVPTLNTAILIVFVDSAVNILATKTTEKLYTYVQVEVSKQEKVTKTFKKQTEPVWEEGFVFFVPDPEEDFVVVKVFNDKEEKLIGSLIYDISALLQEDEWTIEKKSFRLSQSETDAEIVLSFNLKALKNQADSNVESNSQETSKQSQTSKKEDDNSKDNDLSEHSSLSSSPSDSSANSDNDSVKSDILSPAKIKLTLRYSVQRQRLIVVVHHIEDLHFDETKGIYVKLYLLPERNKDTKRKTEVMRTGKNPIFDESFEFFIAQEELGGKHLEVSVCEEKMIRNDTIEKVVIDLDKLSLVLPYTKLFRLYHKSHDS